MKVIGFANKFYTLWEVTEESRNLGNGRHYEITHFNYIKNISFDKETAMNAYPDADFDEGLRGKTSSWESKKEVWDNVDTFRFGKYSGRKIEEVNDISYTEWYWNQVYNDHRDFVSEFLKKNGYEIRRSNYGISEYSDSEYLVSPEALEEERRNIEKMNAMIDILKKGEPIEFNIDCNPDGDGYIRIDDVTGIYFDEVKENYYNDFRYYLPILNGKAKRIKNKTIIIDDYTFDTNDNNNRINIYIKNFSIKK